MEQNLVHANENVLTKSNIASYVHDMKELEIKQFTLQQLLNECRAKRKSISMSHKQKLKTAENACQKAKQHLDEALQNRKTKPQDVIEEPAKVSEPLGLLGTIFVALIKGTFFAVILVIILFIFSDLEDSVIVATAFIGHPFCLAFGLISDSLCKKKYLDYSEKNKLYTQYQSLLNEYKNQEITIQNCQNHYALAQENLMEATRQNEEARKQVYKLDAFWLHLGKHISEIEKTKKQLYALDIVPSDYRTLDCMIEFDQMFRNDLVDTMRQAVMIYEERVFRGEMIRGIDKIYTMLGNLTSAMRNIESTLYGIRNDVHVMSDDIYKIASSAEKFQEDMLSESQAACYATEALKESIERCEWYMEQQYYKN